MLLSFLSLGQTEDLCESPRYLYWPVVNKNKMAAGFSGALQLTDLDDFITPSQVSIEFKT